MNCLLQGLINTILLPIIVIAFVMLIIKLNINPAGPELPLEFEMLKKSLEMRHGFQHNLTIPLAGAPVSTMPFFGEPGFVELQRNQNISDSTQMSEYLLDSITGPPRYGKRLYIN
jgi:hypothetical protein